MDQRTFGNNASDQIWDHLELNEPDLRIPEVRAQLEQFIAKYARPEPVAFQFIKKRSLQLKQHVEGTIKDALDQIWMIMNPPPLEVAGVRGGGPSRSGDRSTQSSTLPGDVEISEGIVEGQDYDLDIHCLEGQSAIELQIHPLTEKGKAYSQFSVKIVNGTGEVIIEEASPFDEEGLARLEVPEELSEGEYAIIVE